MGSVQRTKRQYRPNNFSLRLESFTKLAQACTGTDEKYQSVLFSAEGYSWKLILYPNGNKKSNGTDHISLYLAIVDFPSNPEVLVKFDLFVFDQNSNQYLTIHDGRVKPFHKMKMEWGFDQLLHLDVFKDPANGYLVNDCCEFGVELSVVRNSTEKIQTFTMSQNSSTFKRTFKGFSKMGTESHYADPMSFGGQKWKLEIYPKGYGEEAGNSLSIYLELADAAKLPTGQPVFAKFKLRVIDQRHDKHNLRTCTHWYSRSSTSWGYKKFMPLVDLYEAKKGFVVNDNLIIEVQFIDVSVTKVSSD